MEDALGTGWLTVLIVGLVPMLVTGVAVPSARWALGRWRRSCEAERELRQAAQEEVETLKTKYRDLSGRYAEEKTARVFLEWQVEMYGKGFDPAEGKRR